MQRDGDSPQLVGLIPAAGLGTRQPTLAYPKELLPIMYELETGGVVPRPVIEASIAQMRNAGVYACAIVIADWKLELVRVLGDGASFGVDLAYLIRPVPNGLADALKAARSWTRDRGVCLALPDTLLSPVDALKAVRAEYDSSDADLVLGVFPTERPEQLGPVRIDAHGKVSEVLDKPVASDLRNTWGIAVWSPRFTAFLWDELERQGPKTVLGHVFDRAAKSGKLLVKAVTFDKGRFVDVGTPDGLAQSLLLNDRLARDI